MQHPEDNTHVWGRWFAIAATLIVLGLFTLVFDDYLESQRNPNQQVRSAVQQDGTREVVLQRNRYGHYVASGTINGKQVIFLLDTGASDVSIPDHMADELGLKRGARRTYHTANGFIEGWTTVADEVTLGDIVLREVKASLNPAEPGDVILLGMSFLKKVEFSQKNGQILLRQ